MLGTRSKRRSSEEAEVRSFNTSVEHDPILKAEKLHAGYGGNAVVRDLDLIVRPGEIVALLGPNGAGKTTTMLTLAGELSPIGGQVWFRSDRTQAPLHRRSRRGLSFVTEERSVITRLSVMDNFRVARIDPERAYEPFPELRFLSGRRVGLLSGGEQQMLSLACALARDPQLLMVDELSLGLAPQIVDRLLDQIQAAASERGIGVLLVEQHVEQALDVADRAYVMRRGEIVLEGTATHVLTRIDDLESSYLSAVGDPGSDRSTRSASSETTSGKTS